MLQLSLSAAVPAVSLQAGDTGFSLYLCLAFSLIPPSLSLSLPLSLSVSIAGSSCRVESIYIMDFINMLNCIG